MIEFSEIIESATNSGIQSILDGARQNPEKGAMESAINIDKAFMEYSVTLLRSYHEALKAELAKQGINI